MLQRSLISYTSGGLGNRMRALLGALALAKMQNRRFSYVWDVNDEFAAPITALWSFPYPEANRLLARVARKLGVPHYNETLQDLDAANRARHIQISTVHEMRHPLLCAQWKQELRALNPVASVADRIRKTWDKGLGQAPYASVMIRAHAASHETTKQRSPLDWFFGRMDEIVAANPGISFFLSTDSPDAERQVQQRFERVVVQEDKGGYNSLTGLQAAVADLYLLASSAYMLKPYYSSFPEMAQALAGPILRHEDSETPPASRAALRLDGTTMPDDPLKPSVRN